MKYTRKLKGLDDDISVEFGELIDNLSGLAKGGVTKLDVKKAIGRYWDDIEKLPMEDQILMHFWHQTKIADEIVALVKSVPEDGIQFMTSGFQFDGESVSKVLRRYATPFNKHLRPILEKGVNFRHATKGPRPVMWNREWGRNFLLPHAFMTIWTGLESYLELRVKHAILYNEKRMHDFVEKRDKFLPERWRDTEDKIRKVDYWLNLPDIVEEYLTFPYHNFNEKGKMRFVYEDCFGIVITEFEKIAELQRFSEIRHDLVHSGVIYLGVIIGDIQFRDVTRLRNLSLEFVEWLECQIRTGKKSKGPSKHST